MKLCNADSIDIEDICLAVSQSSDDIYHLCRVGSVYQDIPICHDEYAFVSLGQGQYWAAGAHKTVELAIEAVLSGQCDVYAFDSILEMAKFIVEHS